MLERMAAFTEARQTVLTNNLANIDTPGFKMRDLDLDAFQRDLRTMIEQRKANGVRDSQPSSRIDPDQYVLFQDGNNRSIEKQVTELTRNSVVHNVVTELLRSRYELLESAIRLKL